MTMTYRIHPHAGFSELEPEVEYAAVLSMRHSPLLPRRGLRPLPVTLDADERTLQVARQAFPSEDIQIVLDDTAPLLIMGRWSDLIPVWAQEHGPRLTWQGYAAQQYGQALRQRALVERLAKLGIERSPEPYLPGTANAVERSLTLNFDELDLLLTRAGV